MQEKIECHRLKRNECNTQFWHKLCVLTSGHRKSVKKPYTSVSRRLNSKFRTYFSPEQPNSTPQIEIMN